MWQDISAGALRARIGRGSASSAPPATTERHDRYVTILPETKFFDQIIVTRIGQWEVNIENNKQY